MCECDCKVKGEGGKGGGLGRQEQAGRRELHKVKSVVEKSDGVRQRKKCACHDQSRHGWHYELLKTRVCTQIQSAVFDSCLLVTATKLPTERERCHPVQGSSLVLTAAAEALSLFRCGLGPSGTESFQRGCSFLKGKCWPVLSQRRLSQPQPLCQRSQRSVVSPASQLPRPEVNAESQGRRHCPCSCRRAAGRAVPPMPGQQPSAS